MKYIFQVNFLFKCDTTLHHTIKYRKKEKHGFSSPSVKMLQPCQFSTQPNKKAFSAPEFPFRLNTSMQTVSEERCQALASYSTTTSQTSVATSVPSNEDQSPPPDWSLRGRVWPIYFREVKGNHEAVHSCWPEGLAGSVRSWGWGVSEVSGLSGGGYGRGHNESHLGAGDGVAVGGGAKPSPASGVREEHQLYHLLLDSK